jgi:hypothetical protein
MVATKSEPWTGLSTCTPSYASLRHTTWPHDALRKIWKKLDAGAEYVKLSKKLRKHHEMAAR